MTNNLTRFKTRSEYEYIGARIFYRGNPIS